MLASALVLEDIRNSTLGILHSDVSALPDKIETMDYSANDFYEFQPELGSDCYQSHASWSPNQSYSFEFPILDRISTPPVIDYSTIPPARNKLTRENPREYRNEKLFSETTNLNYPTATDLLAPTSARCPIISSVAKSASLGLDCQVQNEELFMFLNSTPEETGVVSNFGLQPANADKPVINGPKDGEIDLLFTGNGTDFFTRYGRCTSCEDVSSGMSEELFEDLLSIVDPEIKCDPSFELPQLVPSFGCNLMEQCYQGVFESPLLNGAPVPVHESHKWNLDLLDECFDPLEEHDYATAGGRLNEFSVVVGNDAAKNWNGAHTIVRDGEIRTAVKKSSHFENESALPKTKTETKSAKSKQSEEKKNESTDAGQSESAKLKFVQIDQKPEEKRHLSWDESCVTLRTSLAEKIKASKRLASTEEGEKSYEIPKRSYDFDLFASVDEVKPRPKMKEKRKNSFRKRATLSRNHPKKTLSKSKCEASKSWITANDQVPDDKMFRLKPIVLLKRVDTPIPNVEPSNEESHSEYSKKQTASEVLEALKLTETSLSPTEAVVAAAPEMSEDSISVILSEAPAELRHVSSNFPLENSKNDVAGPEPTPPVDNSKKKISLSEYKQRKLEDAARNVHSKSTVVVEPMLASIRLFDQKITKELVKMRVKEPKKKKPISLRPYKLVLIDFGDQQRRSPWPELIKMFRQEREAEDVSIDEKTKSITVMTKKTREKLKPVLGNRIASEELAKAELVLTVDDKVEKTVGTEYMECRMSIPASNNVSPAESLMTTSSGIYSQTSAASSLCGSPDETKEKHSIQVITKSPFALNIELLKGFNDDEYKNRSKRKRRHSEDDCEGYLSDDRMTKRSWQYSSSPSSSSSISSDVYSSSSGYSVSPSVFYDYRMNQTYFYGMPMYYPAPVGYMTGYSPETQCYPPQSYHYGVSRDDRKMVEAREQHRVMFVGNLESTITESEFQKRFEKFGAIESVRIINKNICKYGFVTYVEKNKAWDAMEKGQLDMSLPQYKYGLGRAEIQCYDLDHVEGSYRKVPSSDQFDTKLKEFKSDLQRIQITRS